MIGKPGCHLCDEARTVIERVVAATGDDFAEVDLSSDPAFERYVEEIPVTFVDGVQHDYWRVDEARLTAALRASR